MSETEETPKPNAFRFDPPQMNKRTADLLATFREPWLPKELAQVPPMFEELASQMLYALPESHERYCALRHIADAKDCALRAGRLLLQEKARELRAAQTAEE